MGRSKLLLAELPAGVRYPGAFLRLVERGLTHFQPWWVIEGTHLRDRYTGLKERYPGRKLLPFAQREDCDDIACWEAGRGEEVVIIHDFASPGWEERGTFPDFYHWLRQALDDTADFDIAATILQFSPRRMFRLLPADRSPKIAAISCNGAF